MSSRLFLKVIMLISKIFGRCSFSTPSIELLSKGSVCEPIRTPSSITLVIITNFCQAMSSIVSRKKLKRNVNERHVLINQKGLMSLRVRNRIWLSSSNFN